MAGLPIHVPTEANGSSGVSPIAGPSASIIRQPIHLDFLDGLRGLAALYVVLNHARLQAWALVDIPTPTTPLASALTGWMNYGHFAVTFFITLSGFSLMIPVLRTGQLRGGIRGFFVGRARRILPPYYGALFLSIAIAAWFQHLHSPLVYARLPLTMQAVVMHLLLLQDISNSAAPAINLPMWSIAVESQIYLLFPLLVWTWRRWGIVITLLLAASGSAVLYLCVPSKMAWDLNPHFLFIFGLGMLASIRVFGGRADKAKGCLGYKLSGIAALIVCVISECVPRLQNLYLQDLCIGVAGCCLLVVVTLEKDNLIRRFANLTPIVWVGGFSYSLYLLHFPLQQVIWQLTAGNYHLDRLTGFLIVLAGTAPIVLFCFLFYRVLEKPFMRSKPRA